jgi:IS5 family transposase
VVYDWHTEYEFCSLGVEPLIHYRGSSINAISNNALIRERGYTQRWMAETSYSSVKRSLGDAVRAQTWYREFREIGFMFAISNIEQLCDPL